MDTWDLVLRTPAQAIVGRPIPALLVARRANRRTDFEYTGNVTWSSSDGSSELPNPTPIYACERGHRLFWVTFHQPGEHWLSVHDTDLELEATSTPIKVTNSPAEMNLYWGDLHGHTGEYACGFVGVDTYFTYARDYAGLDFCAVTDHDHMPRHSHDLSVAWERIKRAVTYYHEPHRFVSFLGYEWTSQPCQDPDDEAATYGHRHIIYLDDDAPWFSCHHRASARPEGLWKCLQGHNALVIVHHPAVHRALSCPWNSWNPELERLVEIYSVWGSSERSASAGNPYPPVFKEGATERGFVQRALEKGYRLGICAGGDSHDGCPGDTWKENPIGKPERLRWGGWTYHGGLHGVWAPELTREALWDALQSRRCYGTTGARIRLEFRLNDQWMGSELSMPAGTLRKLQIRVIGTEPLRSVEVVRNNLDWRFPPCQGDRCDVEVIDESPLSGNTYYYVRVTQVDGQMAWSSPVWVSQDSSGGAHV